MDEVSITHFEYLCPMSHIFPLFFLSPFIRVLSFGESKLRQDADKNTRNTYLLITLSSGSVAVGSTTDIKRAELTFINTPVSLSKVA